MTDTEMLDFIEENDVWLSHSRDDDGTDLEWMCQLKFGIRSAYGTTARAAIIALKEAIDDPR